MHSSYKKRAKHRRLNVLLCVLSAFCAQSTVEENENRARSRSREDYRTLPLTRAPNSRTPWHESYVGTYAYYVRRVVCSWVRDREELNHTCTVIRLFVLQPRSRTYSLVSIF